MTRTRCWCAVAGVLLACGPAWADGLLTPPPPLPMGYYLAQAPQTTPSPAAPQPAEAGQQGAAADQQARADQNQANAPEAPGGPEEAPTGANPHMIGDLPGVFTLRTVAVPAVRTITTTRTLTQTTLANVPSFIPSTQTQIVTVTGANGELIRVPVPVTVLTPTTVQVPVTTTTRVPFRRQVPVTVPETVRVVVPFAGGFKVAENESPDPGDRVFFTYNFYSDVTGPSTPANLAHVDTAVTTIGGNPATVSTFVPGVPPPAVDVHRETVGFEKSFLDGAGSIGLRLPVLEQEGVDGIGGDGFGDLTALLKFALLRNGPGNVLSAGLAVTAPTGRGIPTLAGELHPTILQPFVGYLWSPGRFYVEGFSSVAVPTDSRDVTLLFNDIGIGYALYRGPAGQLISAVGPTIEAHVTTPLNNRGAGALVTLPDLVVLTEGVHFDLYGTSRLTVGVAEPVTGPRVFDVEAVVQFNWLF